MTAAASGSGHREAMSFLAADGRHSRRVGHDQSTLQCEGGPHPLAVVAANLEAVGAPTPIAFIHRERAEGWYGHSAWS